RKSGQLAGATPHAVECPEEIHGRGATGAEIGTDFIEASQESVAASAEVALQPDDDAHCGGDADGGGAANAQTADGFPDFLDGAAVPVLQGGRQERLVNEPNEPPAVADPLNGAWCRQVVFPPVVLGRASFEVLPHCKKPFPAERQARRWLSLLSHSGFVTLNDLLKGGDYSPGNRNIAAVCRSQTMRWVPRVLLVGAVAVSLTDPVVGDPPKPSRWEDMAKTHGLQEKDI